MKRHPSLIPLSQDHQKGLLLAQLLKKNAPEYKGLPKDPIGKMNYAKEVYNNELDQHFKEEEEFVFPYLKGRSNEIDELVSEILSEHKILKKSILSLKEGISLIDKMDKIGYLLESHIRKEERDLFEKIPQVLSDGELELIKQRFDQTRPSKKNPKTK
ncbi:MAG: hemerythrin domain-containing protein [Ignavibacterium sp.]|nr:hemerythrin domain-containing protein [Ignavibacterium sp.]